MLVSVFIKNYLNLHIKCISIYIGKFHMSSYSKLLIDTGTLVVTLVPCPVKVLGVVREY